MTFACALVCSTPRVAEAHISLQEPAPRSAGIDEGYGYDAPCGGYAKTNAPTFFEAGETITLRALVVPHTNTYRVALSPPGDTGFEANVLGYYEVEADENSEISFEVTLPETECIGCTLQLVMWDASWYACADVDIGGHSPSSGTGGVASNAGGGSGGKSGSGSGGAPSSQNAPAGGAGDTAPMEGGCSATSRTAPFASWWWGALALGLSLTRKTRGSRRRRD